VTLRLLLHRRQQEMRSHGDLSSACELHARQRVQRTPSCEPQPCRPEQTRHCAPTVPKQLPLAERVWQQHQRHPDQQHARPQPQPAQTQPRLQPQQPLGPGVAVPLAGRRFCVTRPLGKGSFGVVWAAQDESGGVVALKEIPCKSESELAQVTAEGKVLQVVGREVASAGLAMDRIPALVAMEVQRTSQQKLQVRLAMSLVPGTALESFLQVRRQEAKARGTSLRGEPRLQFAEACMCAGELLMQLAPVVDAFSACVYHRDITPRNIQIREQEGPGGPRFGLVDFGLAVDAARWRAGEPGAGNLAGDGRYWPASSWFVFCHGTRALEREAWLREEYRTSLDAHSLGLTALRCLVELLPTQGAPRAAAQALQTLRAAWQHLWSDSEKLWQPIFDAFRGNGDFDSLRTRFTQAKVHRVVSDDLCAVRAALREVQRACSGQPVETGLAGMPALCEALLLMVQAGRADNPGEVSALEPAASLCMPARSSGGSAELRQHSVSTTSPSSRSSSSASSGSSGGSGVGEE